jgi:hypothetical protein
MANAFRENEWPAENRFRAPVGRELVHRQSISEVFLTGIDSLGRGTYIVWAQWPRWHVFYGSRYDPL